MKRCPGPGGKAGGRRSVIKAEDVLSIQRGRDRGALRVTRSEKQVWGSRLCSETQALITKRDPRHDPELLCCQPAAGRSVAGDI